MVINIPSNESISDIPAAKIKGKAIIARGGSVPPTVPTAAVADKASSATSVAVSKPKPNKTPTGYSCQE